VIINKYQKIRAREAAEARQAKLAEQDEKRLKRALKLVVTSNLPSPAREIAALEKYLSDLQALRADMVRKYGEARELVRIDVEMSKTVKQITDIKISQIKPERV